MVTVIIIAQNQFKVPKSCFFEYKLSCSV